MCKLSSLPSGFFLFSCESPQRSRGAACFVRFQRHYYFSMLLCMHFKRPGEGVLHSQRHRAPDTSTAGKVDDSRYCYVLKRERASIPRKIQSKEIRMWRTRNNLGASATPDTAAISTMVSIRTLLYIYGRWCCCVNVCVCVALVMHCLILHKYKCAQTYIRTKT